MKQTYSFVAGLLTAAAVWIYAYPGAAGTISISEARRGNLAAFVLGALLCSLILSILIDAKAGAEQEPPPRSNDKAEFTEAERETAATLRNLGLSKKAAAQAARAASAQAPGADAATLVAIAFKQLCPR